MPAHKKEGEEGSFLGRGSSLPGGRIIIIIENVREDDDERERERDWLAGLRRVINMGSGRITRLRKSQLGYRTRTRPAMRSKRDGTRGTVRERMGFMLILSQCGGIIVFFVPLLLWIFFSSRLSFLPSLSSWLMEKRRQ